jgi:hypothetical protein
MFDKIKHIFSPRKEAPKYHGKLPLMEILSEVANLDMENNTGMVAIVAMPDGSEAHLILRQGEQISVLPLDDEEIDNMYEALERLKQARR